MTTNPHHNGGSLFVVNGEGISVQVPPIPTALLPRCVIIDQCIFTSNDAVDAVFEEVFVGDLNLREGQGLFGFDESL